MDKIEIDEYSKLNEKILKCFEVKLGTKLSVDERGVFEKGEEEVHQPFCKSTLDNIKRLMTEIPLMFQKLNGERKYWNTNSNSARCKIEEWRTYKNEVDKYCPNGDVIVAMLLLDYEFKENYKKKYPEMVFNASYRNMMKHNCECGLEYTMLTKLQHKSSTIHKKLMKAKTTAEQKKEQENYIED